MIEIGECYYHNRIEHIVIITTKKENIFLVLSITSGDFDKSCEINPEDIVDNKGNKILTHKSYIGYKFAFEFEKYKTCEEFRKTYIYRCNISQELLKKIWDGAKKSPYLQNKFKKYFESEFEDKK